MRRRKVVRIRKRRGSVRCGDVETIYSMVVGEGRRVRRCGWVVNMASLVVLDIMGELR